MATSSANSTGFATCPWYPLESALVRSSLRAYAVTAYARSEDRTKALSSGYQGHVAKPVELAELLATVAAVVHRPRSS